MQYVCINFLGFFSGDDARSSTRPVQIATAASPTLMVQTCSLPPHAPCRLQHNPYKRIIVSNTFASTRSVQIATQSRPLAGVATAFASTRSVQIATNGKAAIRPGRTLCLHTLRADCNRSCLPCPSLVYPLPPHAPCRLQRTGVPESSKPRALPPHAPCRLQPVLEEATLNAKQLCLHTLRADCNKTRMKKIKLRGIFASTRSVQIATAEMHRMQYALFRTCVESVDSFSVLNKSMLR